MAVIKENLDLFYDISPIWVDRDQRLMAALGVEFELADYAFTALYDYCLSQTDHTLERWSVTPEDSARVTILARAFIDHAYRVPKLIGAISKTGPSAIEAQEFLKKHEALRLLRNALHHADERIDSGNSKERIQPTGGDFSWKVWTPDETLDVYWIAQGPLVDEFAGPTICTSTNFRHPVDHLVYRIHDQEANLCEVFLDLGVMIGHVHQRISAHFDEVVQKHGLQRGSTDDIRNPAGLSGRLRLGGLEVVTNESHTDVLPAV